METYDAIGQRRSVRRFDSDRKVDPSVLERLLSAACWAPSAQNLQPWYFVALTGDEAIARFSRINEQCLADVRKELEERFIGNDEVVSSTMSFMKTLGGASAVVLGFLQKPTYGDVQLDAQLSVGAATQNLLLAAQSEGLGACWIGGPRRVAEALGKEFAAGKGELTTVVVLGYPLGDEPGKPIRRKDGRWAIVS